MPLFEHVSSYIANTRSGNILSASCFSARFCDGDPHLHGNGLCACARLCRGKIRLNSGDAVTPFSQKDADVSETASAGADETASVTAPSSNVYASAPGP